MAEGNSANAKKMTKEDWEFQYEKLDRNSNDKGDYNTILQFMNV